RKRENIKVRQPLSRILIPVLNKQSREHIEQVAELIKGEVNVKEISFIEDTSGVVTKKIKPNFKSLGPRFPKYMKDIAAELAQFSQADIVALEQSNHRDLNIKGEICTISLEDVEILSEDIPGWLVA